MLLELSILLEYCGREKEYVHSICTNLITPTQWSKNLTIKENAFACHSQLKSSLTIIKWLLNASCSRATKSHSSLFMCSFEDLRVKTHKVLHIHTHQKLKKKWATLLVLPRPFNRSCKKNIPVPQSHQVVFMHCVSSRQALPRSQGSLENVSLSGRSRHDDWCIGEGGTLTFKRRSHCFPAPLVKVRGGLFLRSHVPVLTNLYKA